MDRHAVSVASMEMKFTHEEVGFQFKKLGLADSRTQTLPGSDTAAEPRLLFRSARLSTLVERFDIEPFSDFSVK